MNSMRKKEPRKLPPPPPPPPKKKQEKRKKIKRYTFFSCYTPINSVEDLLFIPPFL
jgi:hypothetical protein